MYSKVILLLSALFVFGDGAPLNIENPNVCSTTCSEAQNLFYETGKTYIYDFDTKTELKLDDQLVNVRITGSAHLNYARKCEFRLQLKDVRIEGVDKKQLRAEDLQREILTFAFDDGLITNVCPSLEERSNTLNIKKAILSAMQMSTKMLGPLKVVEERDILGDCETTYSETNPYDKSIEQRIVKKKNLKTCRNRLMANTALFHNAILERMLEQSSEVMRNDYECTQIIGNDHILKSVECRETSQNMYYSRESVISMKMIKVDDSSIPEQMKFKKQSLLYTREDDHTTTIESAYKELTSLCHSVMNDITEGSMKYFKRLSYALRGLEYDDINRMLSQVQMEGGIGECRSMKLHGLLESALLMSAGKGSLRYMTEDIQSLDMSNSRKMMTLLSLPFISHPTEESVKALLPMMYNIKSPNILMLATAMIGNFVRNNKTCPTLMPAVKEAINVLGDRLPTKCFAREMNNEYIVAYLRAIGNIGFMTEEVFQKIVGCAKSTQTESNIRATALIALKKSRACEHPNEMSAELKTLLNILMTKGDETDEVQVAAFKTFMSCDKSLGEEFVVREAIVMSKNKANPRLAHYVQTYLMNLQKNKNPMYRKMRMELTSKNFEMIEDNAEETMSYNKLYTYYSAKLQMGIHVEMDSIMEKKMKHPRAVMISAYIPIHERNVQLFEIGLRQDVDDESITNIEKFIKEQNFEEWMRIAKDVVFSDRWSEVSRNKVQQLERMLSKLHENVKMLSMHIDYNENTLFYGSYSWMDRFIKREFKRAAWGGFAQGRGRPSFLTINADHPIVQKMRNVFKERGYGLILMDSSIEMPTVSGLPVIAAARSIFVSGSTGLREKENMINLLPNFGINFCASVKTFVNREDMIGLKWKTAAISNFRMMVKITNNDNEKSIELNLPNAKTDLLKFTSAVYIHNEMGEKMFTYNLGMQKMCYPDMFGLTACMVNHMSPEVGLRSQQKFVISLEHSDIKTEGWKATLVHPNRQSSKYMIELRAPRTHDNFIKLEAMETMENDNWMHYDIKFNSEKKRMNGLFGYRLTEKSLNFKVEYNNDNERVNGELLIDETMKTRNSAAYAVKLNANGGSYFESFEMMYSVEMKDELKKKSANTELILTRKGSRMRLLKGNIDMDENMRTTMHMQIGNLKINRWLSMTTVMQMNEYLSIDSSMEYKTIQMTKTQKITLHGKFHDKSINRMARIESMAEMTFTQWPEYNTHFNHTFMFKPNELIENELNLKWKGKMDSEKRMIHILQISKKLPMSSDGTQVYENNLMYAIGPKAIKHELMHKATHRSGELGMIKHEIKMVDLMTDKVQEGHLMYERVSRSPMKMLGNLWWKCPTGEKHASYEFIEMSPNKFKESITLKQQKHGENPTGYILQTMLSTAERPNFDGQITVSRIESNEQIAVFKINAMFGKVQRIKSDLKYKSQPVYEFEHFIDVPNKDLKQKLFVHEYGKIETSVDFKNNEIATYKIDAECYVCKSEHHTEIQIYSNQRHSDYGFRVKSKTVYKENLLYNLNMRKVWNKAFVCDLFNDNANLKIEHIPLLDGYRSLILFQDGDLYHKTTVSKDELTTNAMSQTKVRGQMLFDAKYKRMNGEVKMMRVDIPETFHMNYELTDDHKHLFKMSHPKSNLMHETTLAHNDIAYDFDLRSKTMKDSDNIYDMKVHGKYETADKYDLKTTLNVMKRLRFNFGMKSSPHTKDMNVRLHDSLISSKPLNYEMRALQTRNKREVSVQNGNDKYGIKSYTDPDKSFNLEIKGPGVVSLLKLQERDFKFTIDSEGLKHETSLTHAADDSNFLTSTKLGGKEIFLIKRRRTHTKRDIEMDNPFFKLDFIGERVSPKEDRVHVEWTNKHIKQSRKLIFVKKEENDKLILTLDFWNANPSKPYNLRVEAPIKYDGAVEIKFQSKGLLDCDSDGAINYEYPNYKVKYDRKCGDKTTNMKMERDVIGNNYHHSFDMKVNGNDMFNIDTKAKVSDDKKILTIKSQVKSSNRQLDGAYFDYKREWSEEKDGIKGLKVYFAFKPIFAEKLLTLILESTYKGSRVHVIRAKAVGTLEYLKTGIKYKREFDYETENVFHTSAKLTKEEGGKESLISSRTIHVDKANGNGYADLVFNPTNSMANFSVRHTEGECDVSIVAVHRNVDLIRYESQRRKNGNEEDVNGKGTILGYPLTVKLSRTPEKTNFKMSVKPLPASYPHRVSEKYRMTDCYEPSEEECINVRYEIDNIKNKLNTIVANVKINDKGDKFTKTYLYENLDSGEKRERKLTVSNDKEKSTVGYHYVREPGHCDAKIFLREGRVMRYLRHSQVDSPKKYTAKIEAWLDFERKPDQKLTIDRKVEADSNKDIRETHISHPSLKKPISIKYFEKKDTTANGENSKMNIEFDYSEDANEKLFLDIETKANRSPDENSKDYNLRLHRADKKIDISNRQYSLNKISDILTIKNMLKSTEWKSEAGDLLSVIQKFDYKKTVENGVVRISRHMINKRLSHYFELESETGGNIISQIERMDFTFTEGGPKYRVNSTNIEVENGRCLKFNGFQLPAGSAPMKYVDVCFRPRKNDEKLFDITAGDEATQSKTIQFAITRKPNAERMFIVSLKWNPDRVKERISTLIQKANDRYKNYRKAEENLKQEKERIKSMLITPVAKALEPLCLHLQKETENICKENPRYCQVLGGKIRAKRRSIPAIIHGSTHESGLIRFLKMMSTFRMVSYNPQQGEIIFEIGIPN